MIAEKKINCLGIDINYVDEGKGDVLLFIHNGGGFWQIWIKQIDYFSKTHRVIALDLPGFGKSSESDSLYTLDFNIQMLNAFLNKLQINEASFIGNCIGASLSIKFKNESPEKVKKLILLNICPGERLIRLGIFRTLLFKIKSKGFQSAFKSILTFMITKTPVKNKFPTILFGRNPDKKSPLFLQYDEKMKQAKQSRSRLNLLFASNSYTLKHFLFDNSKIQDALLLWGEFNQVASVKREGYYHQKLCGIEKINVIKGSGHLLMYESPEETNRLIENYLRI